MLAYTAISLSVFKGQVGPAADTYRNSQWRRVSMIRCIRIWTGEDNDSHFEEGAIDLPDGERGDILSGNIGAVSISFRETRAGGAFEWHDAPVRQFVVTLSGTLDFETRTSGRFRLNPGDVLFVEDTAGTGHRWKLVDDNPWRRAYVILAPGVGVPFLANVRRSS
jgi:hypothetical protein